MPLAARLLQFTSFTAVQWTGCSTDCRYLKKGEKMGALSQLFGGLTQVWLNVAFVVCIFATILYKPERIGNHTLFFTACVLFAASLVIPSLGVMLMDSPVDTGRSFGNNPFGEVSTLMQIVSILPMMLYAAAFLCAISSLSANHQD